jgi:hypothetical protein
MAASFADIGLQLPNTTNTGDQTESNVLSIQVDWWSKVGNLFHEAAQVEPTKRRRRWTVTDSVEITTATRCRN